MTGAMGRLPGILLFFAIVMVLLGGIHYYLWLRLGRGPALPSPWRTVVAVTLAVGALSLPTALLLGRAGTLAARAIVWPAFIWLGLVFLMFVLLLGSDAVRATLWTVRRVAGSEAIDPEKRRFFARMIAAGTVATASGLTLMAIRSALGPVAVRRVEIPLRRLSKHHDGMTLVQLTDLHIGPTIGREALEDLVRRANALKPDIIAITGDLVDGGVGELRSAIAPIADLRARLGVYFVTGNHEYFSGARAWVEEIARLGVRVLRNERVQIDDAGAILDLAGVDDRSASRYPHEGHGEDLARALSGRDKSRALVLLAHQPRTVLDSAVYEVDLQISGHTHGGQIWPFGALVRLQQKFLAGLGRHRDTLIYVSRGTGYWGPPMRLGAPAEISQLVFRATAAS